MKDFKVESLAFIAFFATLPLYSPNLVIFGADQTMVNMDVFAPTLLISCIVIGFIYSLLALRRPSWAHLGRPMTIAASISYLAGMGLFYCLVLFDAPDILDVIAGVLTAFGLIPLCILWGSYFSELTLRQALFRFSWFCAISAALDELLIVTHPLPVTALLLVIGVAVPLVEACRGDRHLDDADSSEEMLEPIVPPQVDGSSADDVQHDHGLLSKMGSVLLPSLIGLMVFAFTMGLRKMTFLPAGIHGELLGAWIAPFVVLPLCFMKSDRPLHTFVYQVYLPACAVLVIFLDSFPPESAINLVGLATTYVLYSMIGVIAISSLAAVAHAREFSHILVFSIPLFLFALFSFLGVRMGAIGAISDSATSFLLVISTAYLGYLVFTPGLRSWRAMMQPNSTPAASSEHADEYRAQVEEVSTRYALSPREREIITYMGRGYSPAYIAKTLLISDSTARSHVRNIYRKVGVSSREELLSLFN